MLLMTLLASLLGIDAQEVAIKTNVASDALLNVNGGIEVGLAPRWSLDVTGDLNAWTLSHQRRWKHWMVQPEARYWFCDRFNGHFLAAHLLGGQYNLGYTYGLHDLLGTEFSDLAHNRYQGWFVGAGIGYGYTWILGTHWSFEAEIAVGWAYSRYDKYQCAGCGKKIDSRHPHNYVGPTKAALNIVYVF